MGWIERRAEEILREAVERGKLDGLEGAGKPLRFESSPFVPDDLKLAYKMLADAGYVPPEVELKREVAGLRELLRAVEDDDRHRIERELNDRVLRLNLALKRSFDLEDQQVYARKLRARLSTSRDGQASDSRTSEQRARPASSFPGS